jgi:hypothetical protein
LTLLAAEVPAVHADQYERFVSATVQSPAAQVAMFDVVCLAASLGGF